MITANGFERFLLALMLHCGSFGSERQLLTTTVCEKNSVARALCRGVAAVAAALTGRGSSVLDALLPTATDATEEVPLTTLCGWLLGYPVGYYVAPSAGGTTGNCLGGQPLALYSLVADLCPSSTGWRANGACEQGWPARWTAAMGSGSSRSGGGSGTTTAGAPESTGAFPYNP